MPRSDYLPTRPPTPLETPCREWQGAIMPGGYGAIRREGRVWRVHRWVWTLAFGPIPEGQILMHRCDNPPCFRLSHLQLGTHGDNSRDAYAKGRRIVTRYWSSRTHCVNGHEFDEANTYVNDKGHRTCRRCRADGMKRSNQRKKEQP